MDTQNAVEQPVEENVNQEDNQETKKKWKFKKILCSVSFVTIAIVSNLLVLVFFMVAVVIPYVQDIGNYKTQEALLNIFEGSSDIYCVYFTKGMNNNWTSAHGDLVWQFARTNKHPQELWWINLSPYWWYEPGAALKNSPQHVFVFGIYLSNATTFEPISNGSITLAYPTMQYFFV